MALALLIKMSIIPNFSTACFTAASKDSSLLKSHFTGKHFPPTFSTEKSKLFSLQNF